MRALTDAVTRPEALLRDYAVTPGIVSAEPRASSSCRCVQTPASAARSAAGGATKYVELFDWDGDGVVAGDDLDQVLLEDDLVLQELRQAVLRDPLLRHGVAVAHRHRAVLRALVVHRDAQRRADLILAAVALADGRRLVVVHVVPALQRLVDLLRPLRLSVLAHQRQHRRLDGRQPRVQPQHHAHLLLPLGVRRDVLIIGVAQEGQRGPVRPRRRLDHVGDVAPLLLVIEVRQLALVILGILGG